MPTRITVAPVVTIEIIIVIHVAVVIKTSFQRYKSKLGYFPVNRCQKLGFLELILQIGDLFVQ